MFPKEIVEMVDFGVTERSQPNVVKPKMRGRKLKSDVHLQGALKQKRRKTNGRETKATCIVLDYHHILHGIIKEHFHLIFTVHTKCADSIACSPAGQHV